MSARVEYLERCNQQKQQAHHPHSLKQSTFLLLLLMISAPPFVLLARLASRQFSSIRLPFGHRLQCWQRKESRPPKGECNIRRDVLESICQTSVDPSYHFHLFSGMMSVQHETWQHRSDICSATCPTACIPVDFQWGGTHIVCRRSIPALEESNVSIFRAGSFCPVFVVGRECHCGSKL